MPFDQIWGQDPAIQTLMCALDAGRVHHAYRFEGPNGVGKERAALGLAQALVCEAGGPRACQACRACHRAVTFTEGEPRLPLHPDVVLVERGLYRSTLGQAETSGISIEQIRRVVLPRIGFSPHEGRALVFIIRSADELTAQAANCLLKSLEEPSRNIYFILLTSRPNRLLDTLRSRTLPVRFAALSTAVVERILVERGLSPSAAALAQGSAALAIELSQPESVREREEFVSGVLEAARASDLVPAIRFAETHKFERDTLRRLLFFLAQFIAEEAKQCLKLLPEEAERKACHYRSVLQTLEDVERNQSPTLALESMIYRLR